VNVADSLERIGALNPALNAFLYAQPQEAVAGGALRGLTVGIKDVIDVAGMPTTAASKFLEVVPERDAESVARLRTAGAAIVGKTNTHEFAYGALTNSPHFGPGGWMDVLGSRAGRCQRREEKEASPHVWHQGLSCLLDA